LIFVGAEVRSVNFTELFQAGILHTKMWVVDGKHAYVGSANMDYRSLTQVHSYLLLVWVNSAFHPSGVDKSSTGLWVELRLGVFTCVGWRVTLCDPI